MKKFTKSKLFQLLCIWVALIIVFTIVNIFVGEKFFQISTLVQIVDLMIVSSFLAVGAGFLMVSGNMDLSASKIGAFGCVFFAAAQKYFGWGIVPSIIITLICCICFGLMNGLLVNEFECPAFIATMAMSFIANGLLQWSSVSPISGNAGPVDYHNPFTEYLGNGKILGVPTTFYITILIFIIYGIILAKTKFGMQMYIVGGNPQAARLAGISPKKTIYILFANSGFLAGIGGIIYMGRTSQGDLNALASSQFTGLTAAILGGISFGGGNGNMAGVFVGLLILNTFTKGMTMAKANSYWTTVLNGVLLLGALAIDVWSSAKARKAVLKK